MPRTSALGTPTGRCARSTPRCTTRRPRWRSSTNCTWSTSTLGAFSGHYEGLLAAVQRVLSARTRPDGRGVRMKVVATSATIRGEDRQCEHLFGLRSVVVPLPGPSLEESFYWRIDPEAPLRRYVGIQPTRTTAEMTVVRILTAAHTAHPQAPGPGRRSPRRWPGCPLVSWTRLIDLYRTSLTYVGSLVDFGKIRRSLDTQVNEHAPAATPRRTDRRRTQGRDPRSTRSPTSWKTSAPPAGGSSPSWRPAWSATAWT